MISDKIIRTILDVFCLALAVFSLYTASVGVFTDVIQRSAHLMFAMVIVFLNSYIKDSDKSSMISKIFTILLAVLSFFVFFYTAFNYTAMAESYGRLTQYQLIIGAIAIFLVLEGVRRAVGKPIAIIGLVFLVYALFGNYFPGILQHRGYSFARLITHLYASAAGLFSTPIGTAATIIVMFVMFGSFLDATKGSKFFIDIALAITGNKKGGPAKTAVVSSALMGMVSGSASANVAATGVYTIPLMKKTGYKNKVAAAFEAVASTGSQITPPIMGAGGFIIAETLGVSYGTVASAAIIPAILYFVSVFIMVDLEADKNGLKGMDPSELPSAKKTLIDYGHTIIPLILLILFIISGHSAMYTGLYAVVSSVVISFLRKTTRIGLKEIIYALIKASKRVITISCVCAAAGIIIGVISLTGVGLTISSLIVKLSGGILLLALFFTLVVTLIFGMGLPTAPAYIMVAVLVVPALKQLGISDLAGHLFIFYGACISSITPPVCMAAFTAASLADSDPWQTGFMAMRLGIVAIVIPFFFAYEPALIGIGALGQVTLAVITGIIGCLGLAFFVQGFFLGYISWPFRVLALIGGLLSIHPNLTTDVLGLICISTIILFQIWKKKQFISSDNSNSILMENLKEQK